LITNAKNLLFFDIILFMLINSKLPKENSIAC
jgi:hypothetical protein